MFNNKLTNTQLSNYLQAAKKQGTTFGVPSPSPLVPRVPPETTAPFGGVDFPTENDDSSAKTSMPPILLSTISWRELEGAVDKLGRSVDSQSGQCIESETNHKVEMPKLNQRITITLKSSVQ